MSDTDNDPFRVLRPEDHDTSDHYDAAPALARLRDVAVPESFQNPEAAARYYQMDEDLEVAVNMAIAVGAPLLVTGEPGTGKTQVAWYLGRYFGTRVFPYQVRSNATAEDLKYEFDAVGYLRTTREGAADADAPRERFLQHRALWLAYRHEKPAVLLIDEIDKAPRDFPNDLLLELAEHRFRHPLDPQQWIEPAGGPPIVVVTSNAERRLPDAFLRRCIVHHIELTDDLLKAAVAAHFSGEGGSFPRLPAAVKEAALARFAELRREGRLSRRPATAELLTWLAILAARGVEEATLRRAPLGELPALAALIKDHEDRRLLRGG